MKIFTVKNGQRVTADLPDDTLVVEIGWRFDEHGNEAPPIERIDWVARTYRREGEDEQPFPEHTITLEEIAWRLA